jgi:hypothetical protein
LLYAIAAIVFAVVGYGAYSLDAALGISGRWPASVTWIVLAAGVLGGLANTTLRDRDRPLGV